MIRIVSDMRFPVRSELVSGIEQSLYDAFRMAIESGKLDAAREVSHFHQKLFFGSLSQKSPEIINQLVFMPTYFYRLVINNKELKSHILDNFATAFKTSSFFFRNSFLGNDEPKIKGVLERNCAEKFYEGVLAFYHYVSLDESYEEIEKAFNQFNQMKDELPDRFQLESAIRNLNETNEVDEIVRIKKEYEYKYYAAILHRRASLCLKAWFVFLYSIDKLTYEKFSFLFNIVELNYYSFGDLLDDVVFLRENELRNFIGVSHWDYMERSDGKFHSPPAIRDWILHGMAAILLRGGSPYLDESVILPHRDFHFLMDNINTTLQSYKLNLAKWEGFLGLVAHNDQGEPNVSTSDLFDQRFREITNIFERLRSMIQSVDSSKLADAPIIKEKVNKFKKELARNWERSFTSYALFKHFGNIFPKEEEDGLHTLGIPFFLDKFKLMFVENGQIIYGSSDIGSDIGRKTDNTFIQKLISAKQEHLIEFENINEALLSNLALLSSNGHNPNLIIIPPEFMYSPNINQIDGFTGMKGNEDPPFTIWGYFKNIPIVSFYASVLQNQLIVMAFSDAVSLEIYEGYEYSGRKLHIDIRELTSAEVDMKIAENQYENFTEEVKARNDIRSSLYLDIWSKARFCIDDPNAFTVSIIKNVQI